jgi:hypothetical protein
MDADGNEVVFKLHDFPEEQTLIKKRETV